MEKMEGEQLTWLKSLSNQRSAFLGVIDLDGRFIFINSKLMTYLHPSPLVAMYRPFYDFIHPDDLDASKNAMIQCCLSGQQTQVNMRLVNRPQSWFSWQFIGLNKIGSFANKFLLAGDEITNSRPQDEKRVPLTEKDYQTILNDLGLGVLIRDTHGSIVSANQKMAELLGMSPERVLQAGNFESLWKTTDNKSQSVPFENQPFPPIGSWDSTISSSYGQERSCAAGQHPHLHFQTQPVLDAEQKQVRFYVTTVQEVPMDDQEIGGVQILETLLAGYMNQSSGMAWIVDQEEKLVYGNQNLLRQMGVTTPLAGTSMMQTLPMFLAQACRDRSAWVLLNKRSFTSVLHQELADGRNEVYQVTIFPLEGRNGEWMIGGEAWNITESYGDKLQLKKTSERLTYLSRAATQAIWDWNMQTGQIFRNQALLNMIGFEEENQANLAWWFERIHPADRNKVEKKIETVLARKQKVWEQEYRFKCADEVYKIVFDRGFVVYEDQTPIRMVGSLLDITENKKLESLLMQEKVKKQNQIAEAILNAQEQERTKLGHELHDNINQLLLTSKLYLDLVKSVSGEEKEILEKATGFIAIAMEEIRALSRVLVSPQIKEYGLVHCINELIEHLGFVDLFNIDLNLGNHQKIESVDLNIKITVFRILQEQMKNIIKYSKAKNVTLSLVVKHRSVQLLISDDGVGFDPGQTRRGIGLSNIYERTKLYGGKVELKTERGKGCTLCVTIPIFPDAGADLSN